MQNCVGAELNQLVEQKQTPAEAAGQDYMDDEYSEFNNEEYRMRNVRLRPQSGLTHADETADGRKSNVSRGGEGGGDDAEANHENLMMLDLNQQRNKVKRRLQEYNERVKAKKLAEEKAAKNK
jgi:hypothetical protein